MKTNQFKTTRGIPKTNEGMILLLKRNDKSLHFSIYLLFLFLFFTQSFLTAQNVTAYDFFWETDGEVKSIATLNNYVYIGGDFKYVGPYTGGGVTINTSSPGPTIAGFPPVKGTVYACIPDGAGGWYIGGNFTEVGGYTRNNLARISSAGIVDLWNPNVTGSVYALFKTTNQLYVGGGFSAVGGAARSNLVAFNLSDGSLRDWAPTFDNPVKCLSGISSSSGPVFSSTLYVGGEFTQVNSSARNRLVSFNNSIVTAISLNPWSPIVNNTVRSVIATAAKVYIGGSFTTVGTTVANVQARSRLAAFSHPTGTLDSWAPAANEEVACLLLNGSTMYAGGLFTQIIQASVTHFKNKLASFSVTTGSINTGFTPPNTNGNTKISCLATNGTRIFAGGNFTGFGTTERFRLASFDPSSGGLYDWFPAANGDVYALAINGSVIYAGGGFTSLGGKLKNNLAAIDRGTGAATDWRPLVDGVVHCVATGTNSLYVGGNFTFINGSGRQSLAAFDIGTTTTPPSMVLRSPFQAQVNGTVYTIAVSSPTSQLFIGGTFSTIGTVSRNNLASINPTNGTLNTWNPNANGTVFCLRINGSSLYAGGNFTTISGATPRERIAKFNFSASSTTLDNTFTAGANSSVRSIVVEGLVYAGGDFTQVKNNSTSFVTRNRLASFSAGDGAPSTTFNPNLNGSVKCLATSGQGAFSTLYAGGGFTTVGGTNTRNGLAAMLLNGTVSSWNPNADFSVSSLFLGTEIYTGGTFTSIGGIKRKGFAGLSYQTIQTGTIAPSASSYCRGEAINVPYTVTGFVAGTTFGLQLSDANGDFVSPTLLGTATSTTSGSFAVTIPWSVPAGPSYRLRVVSFIPGLQSFPSPVFAINTCQTVTITGIPTHICNNSGFGLNFTTTGTFNAGNIFSVEVSDASGVFPAIPAVWGTGTTSPISVIIPANTLPSPNYRFRIKASNPSPLYSNVSTAFTLMPMFDPGTILSANECFSTNPLNITLSTQPTGSGAYRWNWYWRENATGACEPTTIPVPPAAAGVWGTNTSSVNVAGNTNTPGAVIQFDPQSSGTTLAGRTFNVLITPIASPTQPACGTPRWATSCRRTFKGACTTMARLGEESTDENYYEEEIAADDKSATLGNCSPNPFDAFTNITCYIPEGMSGAMVVIRSIDGKIMRYLPVSGTGNQQVLVQKGDLPAGMYFYSLEANNIRLDNKRMIVQ